MDEAAFAALAQPGIQRLRAYDPGLDLVALRRAHAGLVELGSNENSLGPSPAGRAAPSGTSRRTCTTTRCRPAC